MKMQKNALVSRWLFFPRIGVESCNTWKCDGMLSKHISVLLGFPRIVYRPSHTL